MKNIDLRDHAAIEIGGIEQCQCRCTITNSRIIQDTNSPRENAIDEVHQTQVIVYT